MNQRAEAAWESFESADVPALAPLCLFFADDLDNDAFVKIQKRARSGKKDKRLAAIEELVKIAERYPSPMLHDSVIASALDDVGEHGRALEVRLKALPFTPSWHPMLAGQVVGNVGWTLQRLGERDAARRFYERALTFDPTNPFVLASYGEVLAEAGETARARGIRAWLAKFGVPESQTKELDALLAKAPGDVTAYAPGFDGLRPLSGRGWARLSAFVYTDEETPGRRFLRAMAVGAAMRGQMAYARLYADEGATPDEDDEGDDGLNADVDVAWSKALAAWLAPACEAVTRIGKARAAAFDAAVAKGDVVAVRAYLTDPLPILRVFAAEALHQLEPGDADGLAVLEELELADVARGVSARPLEDNPAGFARWRIRAKQLGPRPLVRLGPSADDPVFAKLEKGEGLVFFLGFSRKITPEDAAWFDTQLQAAASEIAKEDPKADLFRDQNDQALQVTVRAAKKPALVVKAMLDAYGGEGTRLAELALGRYTLPDGKKRHLHHAVRSPASKQAETKQTWKRSFDLTKPAPLSEPADGPSFMMMQTEDGNVPELRLAPIERADVRIVHGLEDVEAREADLPVAQVRERAVRDAVDAAISAALGGQPIERMNRSGERNGSLDAIRFDGRDGFAFAFEGMRPAFVSHYPAGFRFREHELLSALADATRAASLAPVVQWARSSGTWIVNLWEA